MLWELATPLTATSSGPAAVAALLSDTGIAGPGHTPQMSAYSADAGEYFGASASIAVHSVIKPQPRHILTGHDDAVLCVAVSETFDLVASGSADGTIILHSLLSGLYVRTITKRAASTLSDTESATPSLARASQSSASPGGGGSGGGSSGDTRLAPPDVSWVAIAATGNIVSFSPDGDGIIESHTVNGRPLAWCSTYAKSAPAAREALADSRLEGPVCALRLSEDGALVLSGGVPGVIVVRRVHSMEVVMRIGACRQPLNLIPPTFGNVAGTRAANRRTAAALSPASDGSGDVVPFNSAIRSLSFTHCEKHLFVGLQDGDMYIFTPDAQCVARPRLPHACLPLFAKAHRSPPSPLRMRTRIRACFLSQVPARAASGQASKSGLLIGILLCRGRK